MPEDLTPAHRSIEAEIRAKGPITFARFMEVALYGEHGYYTSHVTAGADYATSPQMHPAFGALIAGYLYKAWQALGEPETFDVIELGAGDGGLSKDILDSVSINASKREPALRGFKHSLSYHPVDIQPRGSARPIEEPPKPDPITGCVISNELLDAFPTHIFTIRNKRVFELYVDIDENNSFHFIEDQPSSNEIITRIGDLASTLPDGYRGEVNLRIRDWAINVKSLLNSGYVLTIDYGHQRDALYHPARYEGSIRCYRDHVLGQNPFRHIGQQDITAHVDFTAIREAMFEIVFTEIAPLQTQRDFLFDLGIGEYIQQIRLDLSQTLDRIKSNTLMLQLRSINALIDARSLGNFKVAQFALNAPTIDLNGLEHNPTFPSPRPNPRHLSYLPYD